MLVGGLLALVPGACALVFMVVMASEPGTAPPPFVLLWVISLTISAGGIWLLIAAFRR